jgi:transcriptional regulator with XRE-family HTH domain
MDFSGTDPASAALAARLLAERRARGWSLEKLAGESGVSRAMISRIERGEASPTANVLARIANGLGVSLASLFSDVSPDAGPLSRRVAQPLWTDPETGYRRRNVSPGGAAGHAEIVEVTFPAGARVVFDNATTVHGLGQQVMVLEGTMRLTAAGEPSVLEAGDCLFMPLDRPVIFANTGITTARYLVILSRKSL